MDETFAKSSAAIIRPMTQSPPKPHVIEQYKSERDGLDVLHDLPRFAQYGHESIGKGDLERLKWWGVFLRRQSEGESGYFMLRIRIPNGIVNAQQLRTIASITGELGRNVADITTRQQLQTRWLQISEVPEALERLWACGLMTLQTGLDNIRNVIGCPLAGLTPHELFDASPVAREFTATIAGNREFTNLPRKFNATITGCTMNCTHTETQDLALVPANKDGTFGFNVLVGGKLGSGGYTVASPLDAFVTPVEAADVCAKIVLLFRDHASRDARNKARLAFLLEDWGIERFRHELELRLPRPLERAGKDERVMDAHDDHLGVQQQQQTGLSSVGLAIPVGRVSAEELYALADVSERYGGSEVRLTVDQNAIVTNVPDELVDDLRADKLTTRFPVDPAPVVRGLVSCTGTDYCNLAQIDTKKRALRVATALQDHVKRPVTVHWSGCQAGCGNHAVADIGLMGKKARVNGKVVEAADVFVGGSSGPRAKPALKLLEDVPCDELESVLGTLMRYGALDVIRTLLVETQNGNGNSPVAPMPEAVFKFEDVVEGVGKEFAMNGAPVAVFKSCGEMFAIQGLCPHASAPLAKGVVEGAEVTCGEHGYRFDLRTGECLSDPALRAQVYDVVEDGDSWRVEEKGSWRSRKEP